MVCLEETILHVGLCTKIWKLITDRVLSESPQESAVTLPAAAIVLLMLFHVSKTDEYTNQLETFCRTIKDAEAATA